MLNFDSVYYHKDLAVLTRDRNFTCKLSKTMVRDIIKTAAENNLNLKRKTIPFGGGRTDAAAFAAAGVEATSIIAQPVGFFRNDHIYHTSKDIVENIDVDAVRAAIELATGYIRNIDHI